MKRILVSAAVAAIGLATLAFATPATAMGSGNPYQDIQVGVSYTVYQPGYVGGLGRTGTGNMPCTDGSDENAVVNYGRASKATLTVWEGNPICADPVGEGKVVGKPAVLGAKSQITAFCDPANSTEWKHCSPNDVAIHGGALEVTLPAVGSLRPTKLTLVTSGKHPLTFSSLIRIAKSMTPVLQPSPMVGGMVSCTQAEFTHTIDGTLTKGQKLVSVDSYACADGWAYAFATIGDGKGHDIVVTDVFEAEGQFWIPKDRTKVCGTINPTAPATRPADSQVPAAIWAKACNTN